MATAAIILIGLNKNTGSCMKKIFFSAAVLTGVLSALSAAPEIRNGSFELGATTGPSSVFPGRTSISVLRSPIRNRGFMAGRASGSTIRMRIPSNFPPSGSFCAKDRHTLFRGTPGATGRSIFAAP